MTGLESLRQHEREHLADLEDTARRQDAIILELYKPKSERIKKYAESLAERIDLHDPMLDITEKQQISAYIKRKYREIGVAETVCNSLNDYLPAEFKRAYAKDESAQEQDNGDGTFTEIRESSKEPAKMDNLELLDIDTQLTEEEKKLKSRLALIRDQHKQIYTESYTRKLQLPSQKSKPVTTQKPEPGESLTYAALGRHIETLQGVQETVFDFPPPPEEDGVIAQKIDDYNKAFEPFGDLKWAKSFPAWVDVQLSNIEKGKHGSAVTEGAVIFDDGSKRPLTRERVGDSAEEVLENAKSVMLAVPIIVALAVWHKKCVEQPVAKRRVELGPKLSDLA
jgi:hypothetical protein